MCVGGHMHVVVCMLFTAMRELYEFKKGWSGMFLLFMC